MSKNKNKNKSIRINMTFEGELAQRLEKIREYYGIQAYTDLIRFLITKYYEELTGVKVKT